MKNVFILEDSKTDTLMLKKVLEKNGYTVVGTAADVDEAIKKVPELKPDLLFADIILKERDRDGIHAAVAIREQIDVPVIFLTSYSDESIVDRALAASPYAYMLKPISHDQLRVTLEAVKKRVRLERDNRVLIEQLFQSQKMEAIGRLAGGIAHNFNNILSVMIGNAELSLRRLDPDDKLYQRAEKIRTAGVRAKDLTGKLLALSRDDKLMMATASVRKIIEDVSDMLTSSISRDIRIQSDVSEDNLCVKVDLNQITQALLNVCLNACDAMPGGGALTIQVNQVSLSGKFCRAARLEPGQYCRIRIQDTGMGMSPDIQARIFEPFFTTKEKERGTGLGLYVTLGIIQGHSGHIEIQSKQGGGATVDIYLPASGISAPVEKGEPVAPCAAVSDKTVLIVDDEQDFLDMAADTLRMEGFRTLSADNGRRALEIFRQHKHEIDLVLLDIIMPEMNGGEVFHEIRKISAGARVVICSGYSAETQINDLMSQGADAFIQKPFVYTDLEKVMATVFAN